MYHKIFQYSKKEKRIPSLKKKTKHIKMRVCNVMMYTFIFPLKHKYAQNETN